MTTDKASGGQPEGCTAPGMHVLAKPIGPVCDIQCDYCFYLEKRALLDRNAYYRMSDEVLVAYIGACI